MNSVRRNKRSITGVGQASPSKRVRRNESEETNIYGVRVGRGFSARKPQGQRIEEAMSGSFNGKKSIGNLLAAATNHRQLSEAEASKRGLSRGKRGSDKSESRRSRVYASMGCSLDTATAEGSAKRLKASVAWMPDPRHTRESIRPVRKPLGPSVFGTNSELKRAGRIVEVDAKDGDSSISSRSDVGSPPPSDESKDETARSKSSRRPRAGNFEVPWKSSTTGGNATNDGKVSGGKTRGRILPAARRQVSASIANERGFVSAVRKPYVPPKLLSMKPKDKILEHTPSQRKTIPANKFYSGRDSVIPPRDLVVDAAVPSKPSRKATGSKIMAELVLQTSPENTLCPRKRARRRDERTSSLTDEERGRFQAAVRGEKAEVVAEVPSANLVLRGSDILCLRGRRWLNDEVINAFAALVNQRSRQHFSGCSDGAAAACVDKNADPQPSAIDENDCTFVDPNAVNSGRPRAYMFNSFFYARLCTGGYEYDLVRRWPSQADLDISSLDLVLVPINLENCHWVLAAIDLRHRQFLYLDSMHGPDSFKVLKALRRWLYDEVEDKHGKERADRMTIETWTDIERPAYVPRQGDDGSCGVFALYLADYLELGKTPDFVQDDIPILRQRTALYLIGGALPAQ